jgi:hypothetical protein
MGKLRRQRHEAALNYANNRILEHKGTLILNNATLDDLQTMLSVIQEDDLARGWEPQNVMWDMLDALVWNLVDENEVIEDKIAERQRHLKFVLKGNHDKDEDEAWDDHELAAKRAHKRSDKLHCGLPFVGPNRNADAWRSR